MKDKPTAAPGDGSRRWRVAANAMAMLAAAVALVVVVRGYAGRSLWYDESWTVEYSRAATLAQSLGASIHRSRPIAPGYAAVLHGVSKLGASETWAYRLPTAGAAALLLAAAAWLGRRWCGMLALGVAASLVMLACPLMQRYMTEIKQYLPAAALTAAMLAAAQAWADTRRAAPAWGWFALALAAVLGTFAGWFAVAGSGAAIGLWWLIHRDRGNLARAVAMIAGVAMIAAVIHLGFNKHLAGSDYLQQSWDREFLGLGAAWPWAAWERLSGIMSSAWLWYPSLPGWAILVAAAAGWAAWLRRAPLSALAAAATVAATLAANAAKVWPLGIGARARVNLPLIAIIHLAAIALPLGAAGWWISRNARRPRAAAARDSRGTPSAFVGAALAIMLAAGVLWEARGANVEVVDMPGLLGELASRAREGDLVVLDDATWMNLSLTDRAIRGQRVRGPWPAPRSIIVDYRLLLRRRSSGRVWIAAGHLNPTLASTYERLATGLAPGWRLELVWRGRLAGLYRLTREAGSHTLDGGQ